ncbi:MAG TPA: putative beta-lysine N-acetyltransferase [Cyanobacteria bacterium UBA8530]|nr:putative beta-lysine N-acetyltransferase [Cyanobacteria bacterium UBA8530]
MIHEIHPFDEGSILEFPQKLAPSSCEPTDKEMGVVDFTLNKGVDIRAYGKVYALDYQIREAEYEIDVTVDYYNRRIKVLNFEGSIPLLCNRLEYLAAKNQFDKIFIKATSDQWQAFLQHGYMLEGVIRHYLNGTDAFVISRFLSQERISSATLLDESTLIQSLMAQPRVEKPHLLPDGYSIQLATEGDIPGITILYSHVFASYPSPLIMPDYIRSTMQSDTLYAFIKDASGNLVSAASADIDTKHSNAEMTDCATFPAERGKGLMGILLRMLEDSLRERDITCAYSMARATERGMNKVFYDLSYEYCGRLINNCDIAGGFEDINIWSKRLS